MEQFVKRLDRAYDAINEADYILVGAGAGFSAASGIEYSGKRFEDNFMDFIDKYGLTDMYSSGFYPFETSKEKWAYWARHVYMNRYSVGKTRLYEQLLELVKDKDYFVLTTNVDHQFWINRFEDKRIFATQGDYGLFQCNRPCHEKLYPNKDFVFKAIEKTEDCRIPSDMIPKCPVCGKEMALNLRVDNTFVEDEKWMGMYNSYSGYLEHVDEDKNITFLELGVGFNTPAIIRYPFEQMTYDNPNTTLIRLNRSSAHPIPENKDKTICFDENMQEIFTYWLSRI